MTGRNDLEGAPPGDGQVVAMAVAFGPFFGSLVAIPLVWGSLAANGSPATDASLQAWLWFLLSALAAILLLTPVTYLIGALPAAVGGLAFVVLRRHFGSTLWTVLAAAVLPGLASAALVPALMDGTSLPISVAAFGVCLSSGLMTWLFGEWRWNAQSSRRRPN